MLSLHVAPAEEESVAVLEELFIKGDGPASRLVSEAAEDGFRRLLAPSIENETLAAARERAEEKAIEVFADNLRQLLLDPPLGQKCVLALDPGFRTGCKLVVLDSLGTAAKERCDLPSRTPQEDQRGGSKGDGVCATALGWR